MKTFKLNAEPRTDLGKKAAKALRANQMIPCVLNGGKVVELKDGKVFISVKENDTRSDRIAEIIIPGKDVGPSLKRLEIKICQE